MVRTVEENYVRDEALEVIAPAEVRAPNLHDQDVQQHILVVVCTPHLVGCIVENHKQLAVALQAADLCVVGQYLH